MTDQLEIETYRLTKLIEKHENGEESGEMSDTKGDILRILLMIDSNFINKKIKYYFRKDSKAKQEEVSVAFLTENIMHLLGIKAYAKSQPILIQGSETPSNAKKFYTDFKGNSLNFDNCWVESFSKINDKLKALEFLPEIITDKVRIGGPGDYIKLKFSNIVRTNKRILGIAIIKDNPDYSIPLSVLNLSEDKRAIQNNAFSKAVPCTKILIYKRLENGNWQFHDRIAFNLDDTKKKKKKKKKNAKFTL